MMKMPLKTVWHGSCFSSELWGLSFAVSFAGSCEGVTFFAQYFTLLYPSCLKPFGDTTVHTPIISNANPIA